MTQATYKLTMIDKSKNYDIYFDVNDSVNSDVNINVAIQNWSNGIGVKNTNGRKKVTIESNLIGGDFDGIAFYFLSFDYSNGARASILNIVVVESNNYDLPYFTGMKSVQMPVLTTTGKNVFDKSSNFLNGSYRSNGIFESVANHRTFKVIVKPNTTYTFSSTTYPGVVSWIRVGYLDENNQHMGFENLAKYKYTTVENTKYMFFAINFENYDFETWINGLQIEEGTTITEYEPFKSNILTVNEDIVLRGIGDVRDTLDCLTGEVTERIGEVVLDGSEHWKKDMNSPSQNTTIGAYVTNLIDTNQTNSTNLICDHFQSKNINLLDEEGIYIHSINGFRIRISIDKLTSTDIDGFKAYLQSNPITVKYPLATESIKTVDLSVVDQDGNNTELSTFNDITYVELSSEGLIPEAELEVATKNEEVLNTMSLEMDDISATQTTLEETSNTQSENVDATMIATTEIYEELL